MRQVSANSPDGHKRASVFRHYLLEPMSPETVLDIIERTLDDADRMKPDARSDGFEHPFRDRFVYR